MKLLAFLAFGFIVLLLLPQVSHAASFDCSKAQSRLEHAICDNPDLSRSDETLATAYATALGGLSPTAKTALQASQKAWLVYVARACDSASLPSSDLASSGDACLKPEFDDRETVLEQSRMLGGLRFTFADRNDLAFDDPPGQLGKWLAENNISYSQIDAEGDDALTFNRIVSNALRDGFRNEPPNGQDGFEHLWVTTVDPVRITLTDTNWAMNHGAPHGYYYLTYVHYLRRERRLLTAADVFTKPGWEDRLRSLVADALKVSLGDGLDEGPETQNAVHDGSVDPAHWDFLPQGLLVQFSQGEIAASVFGAPSVVIPWSVITSDMNQRMGLALCECWPSRNAA